MTTYTSTVLASDTIHHGEHQSACPCGCGGRATDHPATRYQIIENDTGRYLETKHSIDGGRTFTGGGWQPCDSEGGHHYATRMAAGRAPNCAAWLEANPGIPEEVRVPRREDER